jgi:hypothetical protein
MIPDGKEAPMNPTLTPAEAEPNNAVAAAADERLKNAYRQIASADEQLARVTEKLSRLEHDAVQKNAQKSSLVASRRTSRGGPALRGLVGLLLAAGIVGGAFVLQSSSGEATKLMIARWISPVLASSVPVERPGSEASSRPIQVAAAEATVVPASPPAQMPPQDAAPAAAPLPPELAQQLQTITSDIANLGQKIEQLRAAQEQLSIQMASNNARAIGEFKTGQEQIMRLMAKPSEPNQRPRTSSATSAVASSVTSSVSPARPAHQPTSTHGSPQPRSLPPATMRSPPQDQ